VGPGTEATVKFPCNAYIIGLLPAHTLHYTLLLLCEMRIAQMQNYRKLAYNARKTQSNFDINKSFVEY